MLAFEGAAVSDFDGYLDGSAAALVPCVDLSGKITVRFCLDQSALSPSRRNVSSARNLEKQQNR
jgi:hypothetical protein